jgi:hypothetical protein
MRSGNTKVVARRDDLPVPQDEGEEPRRGKVIRPDEERFTDPKRCEYFFSTERPIID